MKGVSTPLGFRACLANSGNTSLAGLEVPHTLEDLGRLILGPKVDFGMNLMAPELGGKWAYLGIVGRHAQACLGVIGQQQHKGAF